MRILVIEDDPKISELLVEGLSNAGFLVDAVANGQSAIALVLREFYHLIILDLMLPVVDGFEILNELKKHRSKSKVLILSAKRSVEERVSGLQAGGDDYLTKPFAFPELLARCQALLRRTELVEETTLTVGQISLDLLTREVRRAAQLIDLQAKEFTLLEFFVRNAEIVISKAQILEKVWNYDFDPQTNVVDVLVCRLRNKIDRDFDSKTIHTIRGVGYVFRID